MSLQNTSAAWERVSGVHGVCVCVCVCNEGECECVTGEEEVGGEEVEVGAEEMGDEKSLTKRDIHTLNEQRRRDIIKVL